jgi:ATP-dependent exoDNAse (exonuclease V) alpha subunit
VSGWPENFTSGEAVYRESERTFSGGDRVQFTAPSRDLHVANRELGTIEKINNAGDLKVLMDSGREVAFNIREYPHLDHGYAVTSHSSQGQTADRVLIHVDTQKSQLLVNNRFAYVSVSRAQYDAEIYTNNRSELARDLSRDLTQRTALASQEREPATLGVERPSTEQQSPTREQRDTLELSRA